MNNTIVRRGQALDIMNEIFPNGEKKPFSISFVTYDRTRKKGGDLKNLTNMVRCGVSHDSKKNSTIGIEPANKKGNPITVHTALITKINGFEVIL